MRIVHVAGGTRMREIWTDDFVDALRSRGELTLHENTGPLSPEDAAALVRPHDVAIVGWDAYALSPLLAHDPGELRYVCCYSGTIRMWVPRELVAEGIIVSNWGDHPAPGVAEAAMTHLLATLHLLPDAIDSAREGRWGFDGRRNGYLHELAVGVYGCGVIGRKFIEMLRPFGARIRVFDPYTAELPDGVERAETLEALCDWAEALVIHAGLSDETVGSVTAAHLAALPDGGIVVNTARGAIIDQPALFAELESGRLRAGLDVLEPETLEPNHPIRRRRNVVLTFHQADQVMWPRPHFERMQRRVLAQLDRYAAGDDPEFVFDLARYDRST